jgi:hypothetical protein
MLSLVMRCSELCGAFPYAKLIRCSFSSASLTTTCLECSSIWANSGSGVTSRKNCFRSAIAFTSIEGVSSYAFFSPYFTTVFPQRFTVQDTAANRRDSFHHIPILGMPCPFLSLFSCVPLYRRFELRDKAAFRRNPHFSRKRRARNGAPIEMQNQSQRQRTGVSAPHGRCSTWPLLHMFAASDVCRLLLTFVDRGGMLGGREETEAEDY